MGDHILIGDDAFNIIIAEISTGKTVQILKGHTRYVMAVVVCFLLKRRPNSPHLAVLSQGIQIPNGYISPASLAAQLIVSCSYDSSVRVRPPILQISTVLTLICRCGSMMGTSMVKNTT